MRQSQRPSTPGALTTAEMREGGGRGTKAHARLGQQQRQRTTQRSSSSPKLKLRHSISAAQTSRLKGAAPGCCPGVTDAAWLETAGAVPCLRAPDSNAPASKTTMQFSGLAHMPPGTPAVHARQSQQRHQRGAWYRPEADLTREHVLRSPGLAGHRRHPARDYTQPHLHVSASVYTHFISTRTQQQHRVKTRPGLRREAGTIRILNVCTASTVPPADPSHDSCHHRACVCCPAETTHLHSALDCADGYSPAAAASLAEWRQLPAHSGLEGAGGAAAPPSPKLTSIVQHMSRWPAT